MNEIETKIIEVLEQVESKQLALPNLDKELDEPRTNVIEAVIDSDQLKTTIHIGDLCYEVVELQERGSNP